MDDDALIIKMMTDAWATGDTERALELHDHWMVEFTPEEKVELKAFYGDDYDTVFEEEKGAIQ